MRITGRHSGPLAAIGLLVSANALAQEEALAPDSVAAESPQAQEAVAMDVAQSDSGMPQSGDANVDSGEVGTIDVPMEDTGGYSASPEPLSTFDMTFSGFLRADVSYDFSSKENQWNQGGNPYNKRDVRRVARQEPTNPPVFRDTARRDAPISDTEFSQMHLRAQGDLEVKFMPGITGLLRIRGLYDPRHYDEYDPDKHNSQAAGYQYGNPRQFEYDDFSSGGRQNRLEIAGRDYMVDLPAAYIDFQYGSATARVGNQQIAWGQALFFRVFDIPNGLDLRRHLILDFASEEYADERISSPGIRASWQFAEEWEIDSFAQLFQPTVYPNPNTQYNVIASQFSVHDNFEQFDDELNYGARLRGRLGPVGLQFIWAYRLNPDGVFRWTASGVNRDLPGVPGSGSRMARTPLEVDPSGVWSGEEWFYYAGEARLHGVEGYNALINEFPASRELGGTNSESYQEVREELDLFFGIAGGKLQEDPTTYQDPETRGRGGFRGHIARDYFREHNYGLGVNYVFEAEPDTLLDQLIVNLEVLYTPDRRFTNRSLSRNYIVEDEYIGALVAEKYHRFSNVFPATYFVFQWMHRTESDLFGRHLSGQGGDKDTPSPGVSGGWDGLVFALQQPFPSLVWRADFAMLYDTRGGIFLQPAVRWKPTGAVTVEAFYNYTDGRLHGHKNENVISTLDFVDELGVRLGYQF